MSGAPRWRKAWLQHATRRRQSLWRAVEAQHRVATMRLVDTLDEQALLEQLLEASKPPLPPGTQALHYLLFTPFRYTSPVASRFRRAHERGVWYGADDRPTACAELAYWRWRFLMDSEGLRADALITEHTLFAAEFAGRALDLTAQPWHALRKSWRDPADYSACHELALAVRAHEPAIDAIRYESARREGGGCLAVFTPATLAIRQPGLQQTWVCKTTHDRVLLTHEEDGESFEASAWASSRRAASRR